MYERFFGLNERPFDLTPNPRYLLMTPRHQEALGTLEYGISSRKGVALVVGGAGTGKTTLVQAALANQDGSDALGVCLSNPTLTRSEFYEFVAHGFGLSDRAGESKARLLIELRRLLETRHSKGQATALIIDEAQSLPKKLVEEVRLLANIETPTAKLLAVVLVGHPELADRLNAPEMQQLKQRVALRAVLTPLDQAETAAYISTRIAVAGGDGREVFNADAVAEIYRRSGGIPRTINVVCDNAMVAAFALDQPVIDRPVVLEVCRDLDFGFAPSPLVDTTLVDRAGPVRPASSAPLETRPAEAIEPAAAVAVSESVAGPVSVTRAPVAASPVAVAEPPAAATVEPPVAPAGAGTVSRIRSLFGRSRRPPMASLFEIQR